MHGEKAMWELHKNATWYFEQILEATVQKTAAVWSLTSHLKNHLSKNRKTCQTLLEKQELINAILLLNPTHGSASVGWLARTYLHQICVDTGCSLEDLLKEMDDRNGWRESQENLCDQNNLMMVMIMHIYIHTHMYIKKYIYVDKHTNVYIYIYIYIYI